MTRKSIAILQVPSLKTTPSDGTCKMAM